MEEKEILISIITVVFNGERTISRTIESVLNQTYPHIEYIIQDGMSEDHTLEIANSYQEEFRQKDIAYQVVSEKDAGIYDAMNKGIAKAQGKIIGMINADDWYEKDAVEKVVDFYNKTQFDLMYGDLRIINNNKKTQIKHARLRNYITTRDWNHPTTFVKKEVYQKYQYACENLYDDFDFLLKIRNLNYRVCVLNEVLANFSLGGVSNEKKFKKAMERARIRYSIYRKNGYTSFYFFESYGHELLKYLIA